MSQNTENYYESLPYGRLGIIPCRAAHSLGRKLTVIS